LQKRKQIKKKELLFFIAFKNDYKILVIQNIQTHFLSCIVVTNYRYVPDVAQFQITDCSQCIDTGLSI